MQKLIDYYSKHIERVRSHASPIIFLEGRLTCFQNHMDRRQQDYISEISQHDNNVSQKQEQAKQVNEWSEEKKSIRDKGKLYTRWCEIIARVLQQDATNTLMRSLSSLVTCTRWIIWARISLDEAEQICSSACNWQTSLAKQLCTGEQVYQGARERAKRGSELLAKFRYCIENAYTELINKTKSDENRFREHLPKYEQRLSAVRHRFTAELHSRRDKFHRLKRNSTLQEQQLQAELEKMEYANLSDDDGVWEKTVKRLEECRSMQDAYQKQYEYIDRLVIAFSLGRLAMEDSGVGVMPDVQMQYWLDEFHFHRARRQPVVVHALTDASETSSLQSYNVIPPDTDHCALSTREGESNRAEFESWGMQLKDTDG